MSKPIGCLPSRATLVAAAEFLTAADGITGLKSVRVDGKMMTAGEIASEITSAINGYAVAARAEDEEEFCSCGAGHGSGEGHTDWCTWTRVAERLYPEVPASMSPLELHRITVALTDFYSEADIPTWLESPQTLLDGRRPVDCTAQDVWRVIDQLKSGAYI